MVTSLNSTIPARDTGYGGTMQCICGRNTITADATAPTKIGTLPSGAVIVGISSKVVTAVTGGTPAFGIGTTAATVGTAGTIVTTMAEAVGSEWLLPLSSVVMPLTANTDVYIGALTGGGTAGDVIITVFFINPPASQGNPMAEAKEAKDPTIHDIDLTVKLLEIVKNAAGDRTLSAIHNAAYGQLGSINATMQEQYDKQNEAVAKATAAAEAKAAEDAKMAQRKAEDEAAAAAKKAAADEAKADKTHA